MKFSKKIIGEYIYCPICCILNPGGRVMEEFFNYAVEFKNVSIAFEEKVVLKNFNLEVEKGEKILISAPSGSGKTTLLKLLLGFNRARSGEIFVEGIRVDEYSIDTIRRKIGYLSQKMSFRNLKVRELITEISEYKANGDMEISEKKITEILDYLKLEEKILEQEINELSGGEKQRVGFLIAVLMDRDIWVFDEITSSLDRELKERVIEYILKSDKTVLMVSHDKVEALEKFRKVVI